MCALFSNRFQTTYVHSQVIRNSVWWLSVAWFVIFKWLRCQQKVKFVCVFFFLLSITKLILHFPFLTWPVKNGKNCNRPNYTVTSTTNIRLIFRDYKEKLRRNASAGTQHERLCNYLRLLTHSISSSILFYSLALKLRVSATKFFVRIDKYNFYDSFRVLLFVSNVKKKAFVSLKSPTALLNLGRWLLIVLRISTLNCCNGRFPQTFCALSSQLYSRMVAALYETIEQIWCFDGSLRIQLLTQTKELHFGVFGSPSFREIDHYENNTKLNESTINSKSIGCCAKSHQNPKRKTS